MRAPSGPGLVYETEMSIPFITWDTTWSMRADPGGVDALGIDGDLRGAHYRWDVLSKGPEQTLVVYRSHQSLGASTILLRELIKREPTLEHGLNVAFGLVYMRAIRGRAEGWPGFTR